MKEQAKEQNKKNTLDYGRGARSPSLPQEKDKRKAGPPVGHGGKGVGKKQISRP